MVKEMPVVPVGLMPSQPKQQKVVPQSTCGLKEFLGSLEQKAALIVLCFPSKHTFVWKIVKIKPGNTFLTSTMPKHLGDIDICAYHWNAAISAL